MCGHEWNECCVHLVILFFFLLLFFLFFLFLLVFTCCGWRRQKQRQRRWRRHFYLVAFLSRMQRQQQCHLTVPVPQLNLGLAAAILWLRSPSSYRNFMKCSDESDALQCGSSKRADCRFLCAPPLSHPLRPLPT